MSEATGKTNLSGAEMAELIGVDPKDFRRFLRSVTDKSQRPGSGRQYDLHADEADEWAALYASHVTRSGRASVRITDVIQSAETDA